MEAKMEVEVEVGGDLGSSHDELAGGRDVAFV